MAGARVFTELKFWQRARIWSKDIFELTEAGRFVRDRRLVEQVNDSSESVGANVAEGFGRGTQAEFVTFLGYSIGSLNETQSHLCAAYDRRYISRDDFGKLFQEGTEIRKMMVKFVQSMTQQGTGVKHMHKLKNWTDEVWEIYERITGRERPEMFRKPEAGEEPVRAFRRGESQSKPGNGDQPRMKNENPPRRCSRNQPKVTNGCTSKRRNGNRPKRKNGNRVKAKNGDRLQTDR